MTKFSLFDTKLFQQNSKISFPHPIILKQYIGFSTQVGERKCNITQQNVVSPKERQCLVDRCCTVYFENILFIRTHCVNLFL